MEYYLSYIWTYRVRVYAKHERNLMSEVVSDFHFVEIRKLNNGSFIINEGVHREA